MGAEASAPTVGFSGSFERQSATGNRESLAAVRDAHLMVRSHLDGPMSDYLGLETIVLHGTEKVRYLARDVEVTGARSITFQWGHHLFGACPRSQGDAAR